MPGRTGWGAASGLSDTAPPDHANDDTVRRRAARTVAAHATDVDEALELLAMLGLSTTQSPTDEGTQP